MTSFVGSGDLESQLQQCQQQKLQIEQKIKTKPKLGRGIADFDLYRMEKEKNQIQERIIKINSLLHPNIIA